MWFFLTGCLIILLFLIFDRRTIRVDFLALAKFTLFMWVISSIRLTVMILTASSDISIVDPNALAGIEMWMLFLVFWEDAFFVLPFVFLSKFKFTNKWYIWWPLMIISSVFFGFGHLYQGAIAVAVTSLYPYFISYRYGNRFGFGTVMLCHILYDVMTFLTFKYGSLLV
jgi:membrane protease YdiL (CAAX protease family)